MSKNLTLSALYLLYKIKTAKSQTHHTLDLDRISVSCILLIVLFICKLFERRGCMSTLTQRKCLEGLRFGSATYVVEHARWRKSRGKRPSLSFKGLSNPKLAFMLANKEFNKLIDLASYWLNKFRDDDPAIYHLNLFKENVLKTGLPLSYFGTNEEELSNLKLKCHENGVKFWLGKLRGDDPAIYQFNFFRDDFLKSGKPLSYFGTNEEELEELEREIRSKGSF